MKLIFICLLLICGCAVNLDIKPKHSLRYCADECEKYKDSALALLGEDYQCMDDPMSICMLDCLNKPQYVVLTKDAIGMPLTGYVDTTWCYQQGVDWGTF